MAIGDAYNCKECGQSQVEKAWLRGSLLTQPENTGLCFNCAFWMEKVRWREAGDPNALTVIRTDMDMENNPGLYHFYIGGEDAKGFRGYGGSPFLIRFDDGREVRTTNLWHQGEVPNRFAERLKPNAKMVSG